jgi:hypothetical protein
MESSFPEICADLRKVGHQNELLRHSLSQAHLVSAN